MARIETDPNYTSPTFSRATAATDAFKKEDVQNLAAAVSTHDHTTGKGLPIGATGIPTGSITSAMIANGTITAADIAPGTITSNEIADGTIATADLANAAVTNAKLASDVGRANLLTNGGFEIWQRGTAAVTTNGTFTADRWQTVIGSGSSISATRSTTTPANGGSRYSLSVVYTHSANTYMSQHLTVADGNQLAGKTLSLSMQVSCNAANAVNIQLVTDGTGGTTPNSAAHTGNSTFQQLTVTVSVPTDATYVDINARLTASCTVYIDNAMLVVGSQAADYVPLHPADDLARCLRYYELRGGTLNERCAIGQCTSTTAADFPITFRAQKAVTPTVTMNGTLFVCTNASGGGVVGVSVTGPSNQTVYDCDAVLNVASGLVAGNATLLLSAATGLIAAEANP